MPISSLELANSSKLHKKDESINSSLYELSIHKGSGALSFQRINKIKGLQEDANVVHNEPEDHINDICIEIVNDINISQKIERAIGLSDKDKSLVRLINSNFQQDKNIILLEKQSSYTAQGNITRLESEVEINVKDILICRHLLEHAVEVDHFLEALWNMMSENQLCIIEVPDTASLYTQKDITLLWEEHTIYFTNSTLRQILVNHGFNIYWEKLVNSCGEDLIIMCVQKKKIKNTKGQLSPPTKKIQAVNFLEHFNSHLDQIKKSLHEEAQESAIYIYGANHIASNFLDLTRPVSDSIKYVIDDDKSKRNTTIGIKQIEIKHLSDITIVESSLILIALSEGRYPNLYKRLAAELSVNRRSRLQSLVSFVEHPWTNK